MKQLRILATLMGDYQDITTVAPTAAVVDHASLIEMEHLPNHVDDGVFQILVSVIIIRSINFVSMRIMIMMNHPPFLQLLQDQLLLTTIPIPNGLHDAVYCHQSTVSVHTSHHAAPSILTIHHLEIIIHQHHEDVGMIGSTHYPTHPPVSSC